MLKHTLAAAILLSSTSAMATTAQDHNQMPTYRFVYSENVDVIDQQTQHTLQELDYKLALDIQHQVISALSNMATDFDQMAEAVVQTQPDTALALQQIAAPE